MTPQAKELLHSRLVELIDLDHDGLPEYENYWDDWELAVVMQADMVNDPHLEGFLPGDLVLVSPEVKEYEPYMECPGGHYRMSYVPSQFERVLSGAGIPLDVGSIEIIG